MMFLKLVARPETGAKNSRVARHVAAMLQATTEDASATISTSYRAPRRKTRKQPGDRGKSARGSAPAGSAAGMNNRAKEKDNAVDRI